MGKFHEWLDANSDAELPEELLTSAIEAYDEDISIPAAKVSAVEAERDALAAKVNELKVQNFDLIRNGVGNGDNNSDAGSGRNSNQDNGNRVVTIDSLFE